MSKDTPLDEENRLPTTEKSRMVPQGNNTRKIPRDNHSLDDNHGYYDPCGIN